MKRATLIALIIVLCLSLTTPSMAYITKKLLSDDGQLVQERWLTANITWQMNPTQGTFVTGSRSMETVFQASFAPWVAVSTANVSFTEGPKTAATLLPGADGINMITTNITAANWLVFAAGATSVKALTLNTRGTAAGVTVGSVTSTSAGQILDSDIFFNPAFPYSTELVTPATATDLQAVATHEVGHMLGLDHTNIVSSTMYPTAALGVNFARLLSSDEIQAVSMLYPAAGAPAATLLEGTVRTTANTPVFGAIVVAVNANGMPVASSVTDPDGKYSIVGLAAGSYTVYAEPMDGPYLPSNWQTGAVAYPGFTVLTNFTTRFR